MTIRDDDESKRYRQKRQKQEDRLAKLMAANVMDRAGLYLHVTASSIAENYHHKEFAAM
jgi:hypothetical protein